MARVLTATTDVPSAGTRVQINNTTRPCLSITFKGRVGNAGKVYVGDSTVSASAGFELQPNESLTVNLAAAGVTCFMSDWYVDAATSGDDVDWVAIIW